jgi:hypothetical protein
MVTINMDTYVAPKTLVAFKFNIIKGLEESELTGVDFLFPKELHLGALL